MSRMIAENPLSYIEVHLTWKLESAQKELNDFKEQVVKDALYALSWSSGAFEAAGREWAVKDVLAGLHATKDDGSAVYENTIESVVKFLREAERGLMQVAMHEAKYPSHSTSVQSNEAARQKASAACKLAEDIGNWRRSLLCDQFVKTAKERIVPHQVFTHYGVTYRAFRKSPNSKYFVATADNKLILDHGASLEGAIDFARGRAAQHEYEVARQNGKINAD